MGVFDKIKSLFIVEEDAGQNQNPLDAVTTEKATTTQPKVETPTIQTPKPTQVNSSGTITDKFTDVLMKALSDNNIEGFDYLEFRQGLLSLSKMPMDEGTRFQAAFSMAQVMGAIL